MVEGDPGSHPVTQRIKWWTNEGPGFELLPFISIDDIWDRVAAKRKTSTIDLDSIRSGKSTLIQWLVEKNLKEIHHRWPRVIISKKLSKCKFTLIYSLNGLNIAIAYYNSNFTAERFAFLALKILLTKLFLKSLRLLWLKTITLRGCIIVMCVLGTASFLVLAPRTSSGRTAV